MTPDEKNCNDELGSRVLDGPVPPNAFEYMDAEAENEDQRQASQGSVVRTHGR